MSTAVSPDIILVPRVHTTLYNDHTRTVMQRMKRNQVELLINSDVTSLLPPITQIVHGLCDFHKARNVRPCHQ